MSRESIPTLHESMKNIAFNLVNSMHMCDIKYGTVVGVNPLRIKIDEQEALREESLVLTNMVRDHYVDIEVSLKTNNDNYMIPELGMINPDKLQLSRYTIKYYDPLISLEKPFMLNGDIGKDDAELILPVNPDEK